MFENKQRMMLSSPLLSFLKPDASVTEWGSNLVFDSRQCKTDSYNWLRFVNAVCLFTQRVSHSGVTFFLSDSVALSIITFW